MHKLLLITAGSVAVLSFAGCVTESISDTGQGSNRYYRGELSEAAVVGAPMGSKVSEADIQRALRGSKSVVAAPGSGLVVVQSGAIAPDGAMLRALGAYYRAQPFTGLPEKEDSSAPGAEAVTVKDSSYSRRLRLAAAQGGCPYILCYWGTLESASENQVTKTVSWVPIVGGLIPDEGRLVRINVHAVLIDVASGRWSSYRGRPAESTALSPELLRDSSRDKQTAKVKAEAYAGLVDQLVNRAG